MNFLQTGLKGLWLIESPIHTDERGSFMRSYCQKEFESHGLWTNWVQSNVSSNRSRGTLRGMHFQEAPCEEPKLVRCSRGAIFDVAVDIRPQSDTFGRYFGVELSDSNGRMLYISKGFAHGFLTLLDDTDVHYQMGEAYYPELARGFYWNDPDVGIEWPFEPTLVSDRDSALPGFSHLREVVSLK